MLSHLSAHLLEIKLTLAAIVGLAAGIADATKTLDANGWEELGLKGLLLFAVYYIGRLFLDANKAHKAEMQSTWEAHKAEAATRESKLVNAIEANSKGLSELTALTKEQTDYFKTVTRNIVDEKLKAFKPQLPE
jgi:hypothetical protein